MQRVRTWRVPAFLLAAGIFAAALSSLANAADPPKPDFFWPYGIVQAAGGNLTPAEQPVLALIDGAVCGSATTRVAPAEADTPTADVGKTVYVVDVLADGSGPGQRPGCGRVGLPVTLYFPGSARIASHHPTFQAGSLRVDLDLAQTLSFRRSTPEVASDGTN